MALTEEQGAALSVWAVVSMNAVLFTRLFTR
jgi:hypothetical protein